jgi:hypothetical protein
MFSIENTMKYKEIPDGTDNPYDNVRLIPDQNFIPYYISVRDSQNIRPRNQV